MRAEHLVILVVSIGYLADSSATAQVFDQIPTIASSQYEAVTDSNGAYAITRPRLSAVNPSPFIVDYSVLGDTLLSVTWSAPAGQWIEIAAPPEFVGPFEKRVTFSYSAGQNFGQGFQLLDAQVFSDLTASDGIVPTFVGRLDISGPAGDAMSMRVFIDDFVPGTTYRFTSLTAEAIVPTGFDTTFATTSELSFDITGEVDFFSSDPNTPLPADPGAWIRVVPEPGSLLLAGIGAFLVLQRRRYKYDDKR